MSNKDLRLLAAGKGIRLWQIADRIGCTDSTLSKKLRRELPAEEKEQVLRIIDQLAKEGNKNA